MERPGIQYEIRKNDRNRDVYRKFVRLMHKLGVPSPFVNSINVAESPISTTVTLKRGIKLMKIRYLLYEPCVSAIHSANYRLLVQSKNTVKSISNETNVNSIEMEDYIDYVSRQFNILLQHLTTVWGLQIKAELQTSPTTILCLNNRKFGSMFSAKYYVLKQSFQYSKRCVLAL